MRGHIGEISTVSSSFQANTGLIVATLRPLALWLLRPSDTDLSRSQTLFPMTDTLRVPKGTPGEGSVSAQSAQDGHIKETGDTSSPPP